MLMVGLVQCCLHLGFLAHVYEIMLGWIHIVEFVGVVSTATVVESSYQQNATIYVSPMRIFRYTKYTFCEFL